MVKHQRRGTSTIEVITACALLAAVMVLTGKFLFQVQQGLNDRQLSARIDWELSNVRERIGAWPMERITQEDINTIVVSKSLASLVTDPHFVSAIEPCDRPKGVQVTIALHCQYRNQQIEPAIRTFWVFSDEKGK